MLLERVYAFILFVLTRARGDGNLEAKLDYSEWTARF